MELSIGITTFKRRAPIVKELLLRIRSYQPEAPIVLAINADYGAPLDDAYRADILSFCSSVPAVYPFPFPSFTGLGKMWNTIIVNAPGSHALVFNDDLEIAGPEFYDEALSFLSGRSGECDPVHDFFTLNGSYSHFCIGKRLADKVGYFDERFLAFGEEDGDFLWRFIDEFGMHPSIVAAPNIRNVEEGYRLRDQAFAMEEGGGAFRPVFNRRLTALKYRPSPFGHTAWFSRTMRKALSDERQYPYERFKWDNYDAIASGEGVEVGRPGARLTSRASSFARYIRYVFLRIARRSLGSKRCPSDEAR